MVVHDLTLRIDPGEVVLLIGHNGSGKSSLMLALAGLVDRSGRIDLRGPAGRERLAFLPQADDVFPGQTGISNIAAGAVRALRPPSAVRESLAREAEARLPELAGRLRLPANRLSGGQRRLTALARALLTDADLYLLDEPTAGLEAGLAARALSDAAGRIAQSDRGVLIAEHNLAIAGPLATRLCVMRAGELAYDGSPALLREPERLAAFYL